MKLAVILFVSILVVLFCLSLPSWVLFSAIIVLNYSKIKSLLEWAWKKA